MSSSSLSTNISNVEDLIARVSENPQGVLDWIGTLLNRDVQITEANKTLHTENAELHQSLEELQILLRYHSTSHPYLGGRRQKFTVPDFSGDRKKYEIFRTQLLVKFNGERDAFTREEDKITYLITVLKDDAFNHIFPFVKNGEYKVSKVEDLLKILDQVYLDPERKSTASRELQTLRQRQRPFAEFIADFRRLQAEVDFNDEALHSLLYQGISDELRAAMIHQDVPKDLESFVTKLGQVDNKIRAHAAMSRPFSAFRTLYSGTPRPNFGSANTNGPNPVSTATASPAPAPAGDAMDLSASRRRGPLTPEERAHRLSLGLCLYCGKPGHIALQCPTRKALDSTRLNAAVLSTPTPTPQPENE